ncbi:hypothetical protein L7F22_046022 [Adiantum nelumboides]|nr:hypothetical protein [Adiantum nelumboides]
MRDRMLRREVAQLGSYTRVPLVAQTALHLPLYFPRPRLHPCQLAYGSTVGILPVYHAEDSVYARAPMNVPLRSKRNLKVVKKLFKPSLSSSFRQGGSSWKTPSQGRKKAQKGKNEAQSPSPTFMLARALDLADEVRALHALWRSGPASTHVKVVQKGKNDSHSQGSVDLVEEVRALHNLWRAGPTSAGGGRKKVESYTDLGTPSKMVQTELERFPKKMCRRKRKKSARRGTSTEHNKAVQMPSTPHAVKTVSIGNVKSVGFFKDEASSTSLARRPDVLLTTSEVAEFEMPLDPRKDACKHEMEFLSNDDGGIESKKLAPDELMEEFKMPVELQMDVCKHVMDFLSAVDGGTGSENLTPGEEKAREEEGFLFFSNLFKENLRLRSLYIGQGNGVTLDCLVCHSINEKKSFNEVLSLVMHATSRVKLRPEHRGYGRAVSMILGWNSNRSSV